MPRISYCLSKGRGEWREISHESENALILRFTPAMDGYINIDNAVYRVKLGDAYIPLEELDDKEYSLRLETDGEGFTLEKFIKSGKDIFPLPTEDSTIRSLLEKCRTNEERIGLLEDKLSVLLDRTEGHHIFN